MNTPDTVLALGFFIDALFKFAPLLFLGALTWRVANND